VGDAEDVPVDAVLNAVVDAPGVAMGNVKATVQVIVESHAEKIAVLVAA
jgi:hypothetical protein